jgi:hypothetical protein
MSCRIESKFKEKWLVALRSDIYTQIQGRLGDGSDGRCCLGVGADVAGVHNFLRANDQATENSEHVTRMYSDENVDEDTYSYDHIKSDFPSQDMLYKMGGLDCQDASTLAEMNDNGETFAKIADYIEENL